MLVLSAAHMPLQLLSHDQLLTYDQLLQCFQTALRKRTWRRLQDCERALYRAALWYLTYQSIVNQTVVATLSTLIGELQEMRGGMHKASGRVYSVIEAQIKGFCAAR